MSSTTSSQNALKNGLFAAHDFIRPDERAEYAETRTTLFRELSPAGILETELVSEILSATWRLRRCRQVESTHGLTDEASVAETQKSIDRARSHAHNVLRRSLAELRKLQTERCTRIEINAQNLPGLTESRKVLAAAAAGADYSLPKPKADDDFSALDAFLARNGQPATLRSTELESEPETPEISFCKIESATPRNAPCPCKSGLKYKRCCGTNAPPVLNLAA